MIDTPETQRRSLDVPALTNDLARLDAWLAVNPAAPQDRIIAARVLRENLISLIDGPDSPMRRRRTLAAVERVAQAFKS